MYPSYCDWYMAIWVKSKPAEHHGTNKCKSLSWNRDCFVGIKQERLLAMTAQRIITKTDSKQAYLYSLLNVFCASTTAFLMMSSAFAVSLFSSTLFKFL